MEITKEQAEQSLEEIEKTMRRLRQNIAAGCASTLLILWGFIWIIGYGGSQFFPLQSGMVLAPLCMAGGVTSWIIGARTTPVKKPGSWRIGVFWTVLLGYTALWLVLLSPFNQSHIGAFMGTVPMFAYVVGGLWFGRFFIWLGLAVTATIVLGVYAWPQWSQLWSGLAGGGSLIAAGFYIRRFWR